ncbi:MAG: hypothetical protein KA104_01370 [Candidatus Pacebacteria bacterium]|nr:hypothetical protein [Candidatus Paceibacterota bacterium]
MNTDQVPNEKNLKASLHRPSAWMLGISLPLLLLGGIVSNSVQEVLPITDMQLGLFYALPLALVATIGLMGLLMSRDT